jgi:ferritin-like metal-binding protein YciE
MRPSEEKIVQYLYEARASELALVSTLRTHAAMAPSGSYREGLERHLEETKGHARRLQGRIGEIGGGPRSPVRAGVGLAQAVVGQAVALSKGPLDVVRGYSPEEKLLKNAKDECATEALEIATYDALERLAQAVGDSQTAELARDIRGDEERMLSRLREEIPRLTEAMVRVELAHDPAVSGEDGTAGGAAATAAPGGDGEASPPPPPASDASPGSSPTTPASSAAAPDMPPAPFPVAPGGGPAAEEEPDLPVKGYASMRVPDLLPALAGLSPEELARVEEYERSHRNRATVLSRIEALRQRGAPPAP